MSDIIPLRTPASHDFHIPRENFERVLNGPRTLDIALKRQVRNGDVLRFIEIAGAEKLLTGRQFFAQVNRAGGIRRIKGKTVVQAFSFHVMATENCATANP